MAKLLYVLAALLAVASASRVRFNTIAHEGRSLAQVEEEPSLDAVVVPWRLGVAYQTIHLSLGQPIAFQWDNMTHSLGTIPALGECSEYEPILGASDNGNFSMVPADAGTTVYASGVPGDCDAGMQIVVIVAGAASSSPLAEEDLWA